MNKLKESSRHRSGLPWLVTVGVCAVAHAGWAASTNAVLAKVEVPRSAFVDDAKVGRDPFFPRSGRRMASAPAPAAPSSPQAPVQASFSQFKLRGISGTTSKRIALINNRTFEAGEEGEVKTADGKSRLRCVEVKDNSVIVVVGANQRHELFLGDAVPTLGASASATKF